MTSQAKEVVHRFLKRKYDPKRDAAVQFARRVTETGGKISDADFAAVRDAGYTDANIVEIVGHCGDVLAEDLY